MVDYALMTLGEELCVLKMPPKTLLLLLFNIRNPIKTLSNPFLHEQSANYI